MKHIGFCMGQFDTKTCHDCPSLKECLIMYGKDQVKKVLAEMNIKESK